MNADDDEIAITVNPINSGKRLDKFLHASYPHHTRSYFHNLIQKGNVLINNQLTKSGYKIKEHDKIQVRFIKAEPTYILAEDIPINILYEDNHLLIINKPAGLIVHPGAGNKKGTLVNGLLFHCKTLSGINGVLRPGIVHRLDKNTSGLIVVAKNDKSHVFLSRQFETREIIRTYHAFVWGVPATSFGEIETNIDRSHRDRQKMSVTWQGGKKAITIFKLIQSYNYFSLIELTLKTGRTHQIRVHLSHINHPVFGDHEYNGRNTQLHRIPSSYRSQVIAMLKKMGRQALHAKKLSFIHPEDNKRVTFKSALPDDMMDLWNDFKADFNQ